MAETLAAEIMTLPRETAIEAARFVAAELAPDATEAEIEASAAWAAGAPFQHLRDVDTLARLLLVSQALVGAEAAARVGAAIKGSGRRNLVLGGTEIVLLAGLGVIALQVALTRGKLTDRKLTYGQDANGRPVLTIEESEKQLALSDALAGVLKPLFRGGSGQGS